MAATRRSNPNPSGTVAFLFTDIEGSTVRWEHDRAAMSAAVAQHLDLLGQAVTAHGGVLYKVIGDAIQAAFPDAPSAVAAALAGQQSLLAAPWGTAGALPVRMALHVGEAQPDARGDYLAPALNRLARLLATGYGRQILLTTAAADLARDALPVGTGLRDLGEHRLRDLARPERVWQLLHPDLPSEFPPLKSLLGRPNNLPVPPTPLIGREREVARVVDLLGRREVRLVTLTGPPGVGKTRLALQAAAEALDTVPDGAWFVDLAPLTDPALVPAAIAAALHVPEAGDRPLVASLLDALRGKRLLLVLDNCEHLLPAMTLVAELLRGARTLCVLATSRAALRLQGEREILTPPLLAPDPARVPSPTELREYAAVQLFVERAVASKADFALTADNAAAVAAICAQLEGIPLALELAAARVKLLPPHALRERLEHRLTVLKGGPRDVPARQQTLRNAIAWSYDLLGPDDQTLLRRVAVFAGGASFDAIEAVANAEETLDVFEGLASLVDASLLRQEVGVEDEARFTALETIREFGLECLAAADEDAAIRQRHAEWYSAVAEMTGRRTSGADTTMNLALLEQEHANLRAALSWLAAHHEDDRLVRLAGALWPFWQDHAHFREGRHWLEGALTAGAEAPAADRLRALIGAGAMAWYQGDTAQARLWFEQGLTLARVSNDRQAEGSMLSNLAAEAAEAGDLVRSAEYQATGLALAREQGDHQATVVALHNIAHTDWLRADYATGKRRLEEALALAREHDVNWIVPSILSGLGTISGDLGDHALSLAYFQEGLALGLARSSSGDILDALEGIARVAAATGDAAGAARLFGAAARLRDEIGMPHLPTERADLEPVWKAIRETLGAETFTSAWSAGRALTLEEAIAEPLASGAAPKRD